MGIVYKARDPFIDRIVAIKTIHLESQIEEEDLAVRLEMEAKSAGRLQHPNICTVFDFGKEENHSFIVIEFAEGSDLQELIDSKANLSLPQKIDLIVQIANGLGYAHEMGVVHRDMKPANIRVTKKGRAKIIDFGLARFDTTRLTKTGFVSGTVAYMSPERFSGQSGPSDDIFALGAVAYELLTYERAFPGSSPPEVMMKIISGVPPKPSEIAEVPAVIDPIVQKCMARDVADRYKSAAEFGEDLEGVFTNDEYQEFVQSPDRSPEFRKAVTDWVAVTTTQSSGRNRLRAAGVPTVTIEKATLSEDDRTGKTAIYPPETSGKPTEIVQTTEVEETASAAPSEGGEPSSAGEPAADQPPVTQPPTLERPPSETPTLYESSPTLMETTAPGSKKTILEESEPSKRKPVIAFGVILLIVAAVVIGIMLGGGESPGGSGSDDPSAEPATLPSKQPTTTAAPSAAESLGGSSKAEDRIRVLGALREEVDALSFNAAEKVRLREIDTIADLAENQLATGDEDEALANLDSSIEQIRELVTSHEERIAAEQTAPKPVTISERTETRPNPPAKPSEPVTSKPVESKPEAPRPAETTTSREREPAAEPEPTPVEPAKPAVPQRTEADARAEIQRFVSSIANAYESRDVAFFRNRYQGFNQAIASAIQNSPSASVDIAIDSISLNGTERASVAVTRTDRFSDTRIPPGTQKLTYEVQRIDGEWKLLSFSRR